MPVRNNFSNQEIWFGLKPKKISMVRVGKVIVFEELEEMSSSLAECTVCTC